jgi:hypothetical protein
MQDAAPLLRETPTILRERQRALVRAGMLAAQPGRGRGSGVIAAPTTVATLLISMMGGSALADAPEATKNFASAVSLGECALTEKKTFGDALASLLADPALAKRVNDVEVQVGAGVALIRFDGTEGEIALPGAKKNKAKVTRRPDVSAFVAKVASGSAFQTTVSITGDTVRAIADRVAALEAEA